MIYQLRAKSGRSHHIDHFLKRFSSATEYEVLERIDEDGTAVIRAEGPLPGFPPVTVEAITTPPS